MNCNENNLESYTIGLDIGIASVGWCVMTSDRIVDLGVRCFNVAETVEGESLNLGRRTARLARRRIRRKVSRLRQLSKILFDEKLIPSLQFFKDQKNIHAAFGADTPWQIRKAGLERCLSPQEWAYALYHICKHRGFFWISKAEENLAGLDAKAETGKVKQNLARISQTMTDKGYRTIAEMILTEFPQVQRNKRTDYTKSIARALLAAEVDTLFETQKSFGNPHTSEQFRQAILGDGDGNQGILWLQKPALSGDNLLKMLGKCTFEKQEFRAPKSSFTVERHVWLTRLNNLRIWVDGVLRPLSREERQCVVNAPYLQDSDFTYAQLRKILENKGFFEKGGFHFNGLKYHEKSEGKEKPKDPEKAAIAKLQGWHTIRKVLESNNLTNEWKKISTLALESAPQFLDEITWVLTVYKEDIEVETELGAIFKKYSIGNSSSLIDALQLIRFSEFSNLSLKALYRIVPFMYEGSRYDEAVAKIPEYKHHSVMVSNQGLKARYLPPFYERNLETGNLEVKEGMDVPRNPIVLRALNQARKVVNAIVRKYGSPHQVNIELARDLSKSADERGKIEKAQEKFYTTKETNKADFASQFNIIGAVKGRDFEKFMHYREQDSKCAYSGKTIDCSRLLEIGYVEVDHILPYSKTFDDSKNNKVLVLISENQNKGNRTPYEYLDGENDSEQWRRFQRSVESNPKYSTAKKNRLLRKHISATDEKEFLERNLSDTRYICRFFKNYVETYLKLATNQENKRCVVVSGQLTAFLRARWGFVKVREESDRHHAIDAAIVAACNASLVKRLSDYSRKNELRYIQRGLVDPETGEIQDAKQASKLSHEFPRPWNEFRSELLARVYATSREALQEELKKMPKYQDMELNDDVLFVSRAPQRLNLGAAHKETIYSKPKNRKMQTVEKVLLVNLKAEDLDHLANPTKNQELYQLIKDRMKDFNNDASRAFSKENSLELPANSDRKKVIVKSVNVVRDTGSSLEDDTVDSKNNNYVIERVDLSALTPAHLDLLVDPERNEKLYAAIRQRMAEFKNDAKKAFSDNNPLYKPTNDPLVRGPIVRSVKVFLKMTGIPVRNGVARNDTMLRVDVFSKDKKFYIIPVYVHHLGGKTLPNMAVAANKAESDWTLVDQSFSFLFSLYPNDYIVIKQKNKPDLCGYYVSFHRGTAALTICVHDRHKSIGKKGVIESIGVKTALSIQKFNVDVLGNIYPSKPEVRRGLA